MRRFVSRNFPSTDGYSLLRDEETAEEREAHRREREELQKKFEEDAKRRQEEKDEKLRMEAKEWADRDLARKMEQDKYTE